MIGLPARQLELLRFIRGFQVANGGASPTLKQCSAGVRFATRSGAHRVLQRLIERGAVQAHADGSRLQIEIIEAPAIPLINGVPLYVVPVVDGVATRFSEERL